MLPLACPWGAAWAQSSLQPESQSFLIWKTVRWHFTDYKCEMECNTLSSSLCRYNKLEGFDCWITLWHLETFYCAFSSEKRQSVLCLEGLFNLFSLRCYCICAIYLMDKHFDSCWKFLKSIVNAIFLLHKLIQRKTFCVVGRWADRRQTCWSACKMCLIFFCVCLCMSYNYSERKRVSVRASFLEAKPLSRICRLRLEGW